MSNLFWRPDPFNIKMMRILQAMCFAAFLPWSFEKNPISVWQIMSTDFERSDINQDLKELKQVKIKENGKCFAIRTESRGVC
jgi:tRNA(Ser,Leu) C12 N-acetylase TAN1